MENPIIMFLLSAALSVVIFFFMFLAGIFGWLVAIGPRVAPTFEQLIVIGASMFCLALIVTTIYYHCSVLYQQ